MSRPERPLHVPERREMYLDLPPPPPPPAIEVSAPAADRVGAADLTVLTYNVRGLPWPLAIGRDEAMRDIGRELAALRRDGRPPDVVLIQEGFTREVAELVRESGYRYWARGPGRGERTRFEGAIVGARDALRGEGLGKVFGAGLHILSDAPILEVRQAAFNNCAGYDCLANKGAMLVRIAPEGLPTPIDVVNTHMNARKASGAPRRRTLPAHNGQVRELSAFLAAHRAPDHPLVVGGDFNVRNSPQRYYFDAFERPYTVVSEFCSTPASSCGSDAADSASEPWLASQDLQAFADGAVRVTPVQATTLFDGDRGRALSDHPGYLVRYRLSWTAAVEAAYRPAQDVEIRPHKLGVRVSWTP